MTNNNQPTETERLREEFRKKFCYKFRTTGYYGMDLRCSEEEAWEFITKNFIPRAEVEKVLEELAREEMETIDYADNRAQSDDISVHAQGIALGFRQSGELFNQLLK